MDGQQKKYIADVVNGIWGVGTIRESQVNNQVVVVVYRALSAATSCSDSMDLVPRPSGTIVDVKWATKQLVKVAKRLMHRHDGREIYNICRSQVAFTYRTALEGAIMGLGY